MTTAELASIGREGNPERAQQVFDEHQQRIFRRTDRLFAGLMLFQWLLGIAFALFISPRTWDGTLSRIHVHVWAAVLLGGAIAALPVFLALTRPGSATTRHAIAIGQTLTSALLIHLTGGRIETHFHVFGSLAFLALYRDWRVLATASTVVLGDHFLRGMFWPQSVYGVLSATPWRALEHAAWVLFEDIVLIGSSRQGRSEMREIACRQAELEATNEDIERQVVNRTADLRASETRFRALVEKSSDGIFLLGADASILFASDSAAHILGSVARELVGTSSLDLFHPDDQDRARAALRECLADPAREVHVQCRVRRDGAWRDMEVVAVNRFDEPAVRAIVVNFRDVTERKRAEEALEEQRRFLRRVIDTNPSFIFAKDRDGRFTLVNQAVAEAYGTTVEGLIGKTDADFNPNVEEVEWFLRDDLEVMDSLREKLIPEEMITDATGRRRWLQTVKRPIVGPDGVANQVLGISTDITERKRAEEALRHSQKMDAIGRLAGGIAHDFNNLLGVIGGFSELLLRDLGRDDRRVGRVEQIRRAVDRAAALTQQLLAFTRKQVVQPKVLDLNAIVTDMDKMLRRLIGADIDLHTALSGDLGRIKADAGQVEQVIMNLAVNARDAMPDGGRLTIETANVHLDAAGAHGRPGRDARPYVMLAVTDSGVGMDADTQARIFEPFFTTKGEGKGTGLGLATLYGIVQQSGGHISVYSEPGKGTTFKIYLPCVEGKVHAPEGAADAVESRPGTGTILLVEDQEALRAMVQEILEANGYAVLVAEGGDQALEICARHEAPIHLLLTDVVMPGMNGRQLAERLASRRPDMGVLFMSGYAEGALVHQGVVNTGVTVLQKPFTTCQLLRDVRQALEGAPKPVAVA